MLIKSFVTVTVAVTTSYRNKNWELKLREGKDIDSTFWNQGSGTIQSNKGGDPANEATFRYQSSFVNYFGGTPLHLVSVPEQNGYLLVQLLSLSFLSFLSFFPFPSFPFPSFPFLSFPLFLPSVFSFCQHKTFSGTNGPVVRYIFHPCLLQRPD